MNTKELREILENIQSPSRLDAHPWVSARFVQEAGLQGAPGEKLVGAVLGIFRETKPGVAPRRGLRLDTRWAEFGLLAAQYFAPVEYGVVAPASLRNAWSQIDQAILLFVHGHEDGLTADQIEKYKLIGNESDVAPDSTLSDWHRKGIARLAQVIEAREKFLSKQGDGPLENMPAKLAMPKFSQTTRRWIAVGLLIAVLGLAIWGGLKIRRTYRLAMVVLDDARQLRSLAGSPSINTLMDAGPLLSRTRQDFSVLEAEVQPFLWMTPLFGWVPVYGGDIASSPELIEIADAMLASADMAYQAGAPLLDDVTDPSGGMDFDPPKLIGLLNQVQPEMDAASDQLQSALAARERLDIDRLSLRAHDLVVNTVDPFLELMHDALLLAVELPRVAGGSDEGPKTYLLLVQNEDEIRPTGGFITAAGTVVVQDGKLSGLKFEDSGNMDDWDQPYPSAPWQLSEYMNNPVMVFRDANWFTDFPRSAQYAEYLYAYAKGHSVDGVIAFDQHLLVELLRVLGPIEVEGADDPVNADNVIAFMRESKIWTEESRTTPGWNNKLFMNRISSALLEKIFSGDVPLEKLAVFAVQVLDERHLMLQFDNAIMSDLLSRRGWDGAVKPGDGDFLMVVDSNIGFNKTNAVVNTGINYSIDLSNLAVPVGQVVVEHTNNSSSEVLCSLRDRITIKDQGNYPIDRCYWDYLRIYTVAGARLLQATPQSIPAEWMLRGEAVSAHVDTLNEELDGVATYGLLKVVPGERSIGTKLRYVLPVDVLSIRPGTRQVIYHFKVKKQPGTIAIPITIQVILPKDVVLLSIPNGSQTVDNVVNYESNLRTDLEFEIVFEVP